MTDIFVTMYKKRFCLPCDTDIEDKSNNCICVGGYNHIACLFKGKGRRIDEG